LLLFEGIETLTVHSTLPSPPVNFTFGKNIIMKKSILLLIAFSSLVISSCKDTKVEKVIFTSPEGRKREFRLDDGDGSISSGGAYQEYRSLTFSILKSSYQVKTENKVYYSPLDHIVEIPK